MFFIFCTFPTPYGSNDQFTIGAQVRPRAQCLLNLYYQNEMKNKLYKLYVLRKYIIAEKHLASEAKTYTTQLD